MKKLKDQLILLPSCFRELAKIVPDFSYYLNPYQSFIQYHTLNLMFQLQKSLLYMGQCIQKWTKYFVKTAFKKFEVIRTVCLSRPYHFKNFKGCLPQILLDPFLNTLFHMRKQKDILLLSVIILYIITSIVFYVIFHFSC